MYILGGEARHHWVWGALLFAAGACSPRGSLLVDGGALVDADMARTDVSADDSNVLEDAARETFSPCPLTASGEPAFVNFAAGALWRGFVVLDRGDARTSSPRPVRVALHALVDRPSDPEIHAADVQLPAAWPTTLSPYHPEIIVGPAAHSAAVGGVTPDGKTLVLTYYGHPGSSRSALHLFPIDVATWAAGPFAQIASGDWVVSRGLASGPGLEPRSELAGQGFGIVWSIYSPDVGADVVQAATLRTDGTVSSGPWRLDLGAAGEPDLNAAVIWSGTSYLFGAVQQPCSGDDPSCRPGSVTIARTPTGTDDAKLQSVGSFPLESTDACCLRFAAYGGVVWAAWLERPGGAGAWNVRLVRLAPDGAAREAPVTIAAAVQVAARPGLAANRNGLLVAWMESSVGGVLLQLRQYGPDGNAIGLPTTRDLGANLDSQRGFDVASIDNPSGVLIGWSGSRESDGHIAANTTALLRFECGGQ